jgi:hypothetical protein
VLNSLPTHDPHVPYPDHNTPTIPNTTITSTNTTQQLLLATCRRLHATGLSLPLTLPGAPLASARVWRGLILAGAVAAPVVMPSSLSFAHALLINCDLRVLEDKPREQSLPDATLTAGSGQAYRALLLSEETRMQRVARALQQRGVRLVLSSARCSPLTVAALASCCICLAHCLDPGDLRRVAVACGGNLLVYQTFTLDDVDASSASQLSTWPVSFTALELARKPHLQIVPLSDPAPNLSSVDSKGATTQFPDPKPPLPPNLPEKTIPEKSFAAPAGLPRAAAGPNPTFLSHPGHVQNVVHAPDPTFTAAPATPTPNSSASSSCAGAWHTWHTLVLCAPDATLCELYARGVRALLRVLERWVEFEFGLGCIAPGPCAESVGCEGGESSRVSPPYQPSLFPHSKNTQPQPLWLLPGGGAAQLAMGFWLEKTYTENTKENDPKMEAKRAAAVTFSTDDVAAYTQRAACIVSQACLALPVALLHSGMLALAPAARLRTALNIVNCLRALWRTDPSAGIGLVATNFERVMANATTPVTPSPPTPSPTQTHPGPSQWGRCWSQNRTSTCARTGSQDGGSQNLRRALQQAAEASSTRDKHTHTTTSRSEIGPISYYFVVLSLVLFVFHRPRRWPYRSLEIYTPFDIKACTPAYISEEHFPPRHIHRNTQRL